MLVATVAAEGAFWACLILGFVVRYALKLPKLGLLLLAATPLIDLLLLMFGYFSLKETGEANFMHGFAAFYIAFSLVFGFDIVSALDKRFGGKAQSTNFSSDKKKQFRKCLLACLLTALMLAAGILITGKAGSFWLIYWLIAVAFTPLIWWGLEKMVAHRGSQKK